MTCHVAPRTTTHPGLPPALSEAIRLALQRGDARIVGDSLRVWASPTPCVCGRVKCFFTVRQTLPEGTWRISCLDCETT
jgi:hypothetical protein